MGQASGYGGGRRDLRHWPIFFMTTHIVNIAQIKALESVFVSPDELACPVLPDRTKDHLLSRTIETLGLNHDS